MNSQISDGEGALNRTLGPWMLWGLGVGYVISGMYFGWNLGLPEGGPLGLLVAILLVTLMYVSFVLSYAELSCLWPKAGGAFIFCQEGLGPKWGFLAGLAQCIEFVFAPPAIAAAVGAYFHLFFPSIHPLGLAVGIYFVFTGLNIYGVRQSAVFEFVVTVLAVLELLIFASVTLPHFQWDRFSDNALPNGWRGVLPAIPYAIWFYLGIEGIANVAEETRNPQKDLVRGFSLAIVTLVLLALLTFFATVGINGWEAVVFQPGTTTPSDSPLPLALKQVVGENHLFYHLLVSIGLCGLLASFHGLILVAGRATLEFGRVGYLPAAVGRILPGRQTPAAALVVNLIIGLIALLTGRTSEIITLAVFGALTLYAVSMASLIRLRTKSPGLTRSFRAPLYPILPLTALVLSVFSLGSMAYFHFQVGIVYLGMLAFGYVWYYGITLSKKPIGNPL